MEKVDLTKQFAYRLRDALINAGFHSSRSTSGVNIHKLAEITGYSTQICRKYLRGEVVPEPSKLVEIAHSLQVSPGWLLFGDAHNDNAKSNNYITISRNLLQHIFSNVGDLYNSADSSLKIGPFLMELINDVSQIDASESQSKKIVDLALASARHFKKTS